MSLKYEPSSEPLHISASNCSQIQVNLTEAGGTATTNIQCDSASSLLSVLQGLKFQGFRVQGAGCRGVGCRVSECGAQGFRVDGAGFRCGVQGAGSATTNVQCDSASSLLSVRLDGVECRV
jgi:hypothetical protein